MSGTDSLEACSFKYMMLFDITKVIKHLSATPNMHTHPVVPLQLYMYQLN